MFYSVKCLQDINIYMLALCHMNLYLVIVFKNIGDNNDFFEYLILKWCILINRWYYMLLYVEIQKTGSCIIFATAFIHVGCRI